MTTGAQAAAVASQAPPADAPTQAAASVPAQQTSASSGAFGLVRPGLTGLGGALLGCLVVALGSGLDLAFGDGPGLGLGLSFLLSCLLTPLLVRREALLLIAVMAPSLFAGGVALTARLSGQNHGTRQLVLDVSTSLALSAPILFLGTAVVTAIAIARGLSHLVRRRTG